MDVTLSPQYHKKIKYANKATGIIIVNPGGAKGQKLLEPHICVLSISEFTGPRWLNLDPFICEEIKDDLNFARAALWGGPTSQAFHNLKARAKSKWKNFKEDIRSNASQVQYEKRVFREIAVKILQGQFVVELIAHAQYAKEVGYKDYAESVEALAGAQITLARNMLLNNGKLIPNNCGYIEIGDPNFTVNSIGRVLNSEARKLMESILRCDQ